MVKRSREDEDVEVVRRSPKRQRSITLDRLSKLSDELVLRVLSYLPVPQLTVCARLSRKYNTLAGDNQLWKQQYYDRFVKPRASKIVSGDAGDITSRALRWGADEHSHNKLGARTTWKRQYRLRQNWTRGQATVSEIPVSVEASVPPVILQMHAGIVYVADMGGLRAWSTKAGRKMVAQTSFESSESSSPTALSVDTNHSQTTSRVVVGFENGAFGVYDLDREGALFFHLYSHPASSSGVIATAAISWPFVVTMTATQSLSLYRFKRHTTKGTQPEALDPPILMHSLKSRSVWPPLSTSLRRTSTTITISIAYSLPTYLSGWTVGLQEVRVSSRGDFLSSRVASAIEQHYRPLAFAAPPLVSHLPLPVIGPLATSTATELRHIHSKPTSLSYTHPYMLVSHPDNTLTLYLVTSTDDILSISAGSRLWGHTSSVSGAHVGGRGKAVSVSRRGDELRVWELEGGFASTAAKKRLAAGELSIQIRSSSRPATAPEWEMDLRSQPLSTKPLGSCATESQFTDKSDLTLTRGWIGFDEENVVLLKEQCQGRQALVVYDFT
ncbi:hypothetical protein LTR62_001714 [Meristemomyces frigidus]|uniref:F-box domain-containing protein n=1 Tax=Meristemomyces frigidus TaxID=1508187 RepID=A0AAN7YKX2_9PEZI|nr:hypothetical protein LTR62_001714 [Meristemomyces frigidus]